MGHRLWRETEEKLNAILSGDDSLSLQTLSSIRSLIINPTTSDLTISAILEALTHTLSLHHRRHDHYRILSLLAELSLHHPNLSPSVSTSLFSLSSTLLSDVASSPRLAAAALSALLSVAAINDLDDSLLVSLCFRPCVAVRVWFLKNAMRFGMRPNLLLTVLLGFTKDPYPCVRQAALNGLVHVCESVVEVDDCGIIEGCYFRSVELLQDREDYVRIAAVRSVSWLPSFFFLFFWFVKL